MLARIATVAVAGVAAVTCAWFAIGIRQAHALSGADAMVSSSRSLTAAQARDADQLLHEARFLNPDLEVNILQARVVGGRGDRARADRLLEQVGHQEPSNLEAWAWLGRLAAGRSQLLRAFANLAALDPQITRRR
jgi:predicted Zn-dependent protease